MSLFSDMDLKLENAANPAEFAALAYTKQQIVWGRRLSLYGIG